MLARRCDVVRAEDKDVPVFDVHTQVEQIEATTSRQRLFAALTSALGLLASCLPASDGQFDGPDVREPGAITAGGVQNRTPASRARADDMRLDRLTGRKCV